MQSLDMDIRHVGERQSNAQHREMRTMKIELGCLCIDVVNCMPRAQFQHKLNVQIKWKIKSIGRMIFETRSTIRFVHIGKLFLSHARPRHCKF